MIMSCFGGIRYSELGSNLDAIGDTMDRHARVPRQQFVHQALEIGRQVLDDDVGHAAVVRHRLKHLLQRLQTAGRRPHADDIKVVAASARSESPRRDVRSVMLPRFDGRKLPVRTCFPPLVGQRDAFSAKHAS